MTILKNGSALTSEEQWKKDAGPIRPNQWKEGRSALELARAWLAAGDHFPEEVRQAFERTTWFGEVRSWQAEPEVRLPFDAAGGNTRNSDLVVVANDKHGTFVVAVEAKADEPFGKTTSDQLADALDTLLTKPRSKQFGRIEDLCRSILGPRHRGDVPLKDIHYQLLSATAGAVCEAARRHCERAVLLIHEFVTPRTRDKRHLANQMALDLFVRRISQGNHRTVPCGQIVGPLTLPGQPLFSNSIKFFVAKVSRNIRDMPVANSG